VLGGEPVALEVQLECLLRRAIVRIHSIGHEALEAVDLEGARVAWRIVVTGCGFQSLLLRARHARTRPARIDAISAPIGPGGCQAYPHSV